MVTGRDQPIYQRAVGQTQGNNPFFPLNSTSFRLPANGTAVCDNGAETHTSAFF